MKTKDGETRLFPFCHLETPFPSANIKTMRKVKFVNGEYYHIFNRGVDKRPVFIEQYDFQRFFQGMKEFNNIDPIGSIYENSFRKNADQLGISKLVSFACYCLNPNHYHFVIKQLTEQGVEKFMHRLGIGYTKYFNKKYERNGFLFQGPFKAIYINTNEYLLHLSAYVNLNEKVHELGNGVSKSSWNEYIKNIDVFCEKSIILNQFKNVSEYKIFAEEAIEGIKECRNEDIDKFLLE